MKIKCKKCGLKCKLRSSKDVKCDRGDCDVKYNMTSSELHFYTDDMDFEKEYVDEVKVIAIWETDKPQNTSPTSPAQWAEWCEQNMGCY